MRCWRCGTLRRYLYSFSSKKLCRDCYEYEVAIVEKSHGRKITKEDEN